MNAEQKLNQWGQVVTNAWQDKGFKSRLLANPSAVLKEHGLETPSGIQIRVVENTDKILHLTLPAKPCEGELSEAELAGVAGGSLLSFFRSNLGILSGTSTKTPQETAAGTTGTTTPTSPAPGTPPSGGPA